MTGLKIRFEDAARFRTIIASALNASPLRGRRALFFLSFETEKERESSSLGEMTGEGRASGVTGNSGSARDGRYSVAEATPAKRTRALPLSERARESAPLSFRPSSSPLLLHPLRLALRLASKIANDRVRRERSRKPQTFSNTAQRTTLLDVSMKSSESFCIRRCAL